MKTSVIVAQGIYAVPRPTTTGRPDRRIRPAGSPQAVHDHPPATWSGRPATDIQASGERPGRCRPGTARAGGRACSSGSAAARMRSARYACRAPASDSSGPCAAAAAAAAEV